MTETIDFVALVQNNPLTKLNSNYGSKIIQKIQERFSPEIQQFYIANCFCYLNFNSKTDFPVILDRIWKWMGYSRLDHCKSVLLKHFKLDIDYKIENFASEDAGAKTEPMEEQEKQESRGGHNREYITMTINCFKKLCLKSKTSNADKIHEYYVELEDLLNELVVEQATELQLKLQLKDKQLQLKDKHKEEHMLTNFNKKSIIYVGYTEYNIIKTGYTDDIETRLKDHKRDIGSNFTFEFIYESTRNREIERQMYKHPILSKKRISKVYPGRATPQTELFQLDESFTILDVDKIIKEIKNTVESNLLLQNEVNILEIENKLLKNELKPKVKEVKLLIDEGTFPILAFDIKSKNIIRLNKLADAKRYLNVDPITIKNYINNKKHLNGYILRSDIIGPYWTLPDNFKFSNVVKQTLQNIFIKRIDKITNEIVYFNSITEASLYLQQELDQEEIVSETSDSIKLKKALGELLRNMPTRKDIINKYKWYKMKQIGFIVNLDGTKLCIDEYENQTKQSIDNKQIDKPTDIKPTDKQQNLPIIIRDLDTGEEKIYAEGYSIKIYKEYGMRKETLEKFLNKPHNYKNYTFRTKDNPQWNPPSTYMRNKQLDNARVNYYLKVINTKTNNITYHHSITDIALSLFPNEDKINTSHYIIKKLNNGSNPSLLIDYNIVKLESCGELVYPDGTIENIEKVL